MAFNSRGGSNLFPLNSSMSQRNVPGTATTTSTTAATNTSMNVNMSSNVNSFVSSSARQRESMNVKSCGKQSIRDLLAEIDDVSREEFEDNIKPAIYEQLDKNESYENSNLSCLVQHYLDTYSKRTFKILIGLDSPLDEQLFNGLLTRLNTVHSDGNLQHVLVLLSNIVQTSPSWLVKFINSASLKQFFTILKSGQDVVILGYAVLILVELIATLPSVISDCLHEIFECFSRLTAFLFRSKPQEGAEPNVLFLQMNSIVYRLFLRLYGLYPCNFISYLKANYGSDGNASNAKIFATIIQPMMGKIRFHPSLIATSREDECKNSRWFYKEPHDILAECAHYAIDPMESNFDSHYSLDGQECLDDVYKTALGPEHVHFGPGSFGDGNDDGDEEDTSSSSNSFVSHHETFPIVHKTDNDDVIFNQMNENVKGSNVDGMSMLSSSNLEGEALDALRLSGKQNPTPEVEDPPTNSVNVIPVQPRHSSRTIAISPFKPIDNPKDSEFKEFTRESKILSVSKKNILRSDARIFCDRDKDRGKDDEEEVHHSDEDLEVKMAMESSNSQSSKNNLLLNVDHSELVGNIKKSFKKASSRIRYQSHCLPESGPGTWDSFCLDQAKELEHLKMISQSCPAFCFQFLSEHMHDTSGGSRTHSRTHCHSNGFDPSSVHSSNVNSNANHSKSRCNSNSIKDGRRSRSETRRLSSSTLKDAKEDLAKENRRINRKKACKSVDFTKEGQMKYRQIQKQLKQQQSIDLNRLIRARIDKNPNQNNFTPHELLDRVMLLTSEIFHNSIVNSSAPGTVSGPSIGTVPSAASISDGSDLAPGVDFLVRRGSNVSGMSSNENIHHGYGLADSDVRKQEALMYAQLLFERHQRKQHALRIRRVYKQNKEYTEVQERLNEYKSTNKSLKEMNFKMSKELEENQKEYEKERQGYQKKIEELEKELGVVREQYQQMANEKEKNEQKFKDEIRDVNATYRAAKIELDDFQTNHWTKNVDTVKLQAENLDMKNQIILYGEFYRQIKDCYDKSKTFSDVNDKFFIEALKNDNKDLKHQLQDAKFQIDCLNAKCSKLELELSDGESILRTKSDNQEIAVLTDQLKNKEAEISSLKSVVIYYEKYTLNLKGQQAKLERDNAMHAQRLLAAQRSDAQQRPGSATPTGPGPMQPTNSQH